MARELKDSGIEWIGEIPRTWDVRPIKNSFSIVSGSTPDSDKAEYWEGDIPWITPADFKTIDKFTSGGLRFITDKGYYSCSTNMIPKGSIIFSKRAPIGSVVINKIDLCTNQGCLSCIKNDKTNSVYFYYLMSVYDDVFNLFGSGTTFKEISATAFGDFILPLPPLEEQQLISSFLDSKCAEIDKAIEATKASIEEYKKLRQAIITEAVTKGLDPNVEMKDSGVKWIGAIPKEWNLSQISFFTFSRSGATPDRQKAEYWMEGNIPWMSSGEVNKTLVFETKESITEIATQKTSAKVLPVNSVMVALNGQGKTKGMSAILKIRAACNQSLCAFQCDESNLHYRYLFYSFQSMYKFLRSQAGDDLRDGLAASFVRKQKIALPPIGHQFQIADYLDSKCSEIDSLIKSKENLIEELTAYRKSLIYEYVTGKKEVPAV